MPNPIYNQGIDFVTGFLTPSREDVLFTTRMNKALEERGYLEFRYGAPASEGLYAGEQQNPITSRRLPFFEDPAIKEHGEARYAENHILMRNESVRMFTGAEPRKFSLELLLTLPHILYILGNRLGTFAKDVQRDVEKTRARMVDIVRDDFKISDSTINTSIRTSSGQTAGVVVIDSDKDAGPRYPTSESIEIPAEDTLNQALYTFAADPESYKQSDMYAYICHLVNIVISSVRSSLGSGSSPMYGPPIALLKYGAVYDHVPCIVKDYRIEYRPDSGTDHVSLYPRVIRLKLSLEEFRQSHGILHGDTTDFPWGWDTIFNEGKEPRSSR